MVDIHQFFSGNSEYGIGADDKLDEVRLQDADGNTIQTINLDKFLRNAQNTVDDLAQLIEGHLKATGNQQVSFLFNPNLPGHDYIITCYDINSQDFSRSEGLPETVVTRDSLFSRETIMRANLNIRGSTGSYYENSVISDSPDITQYKANFMQHLGISGNPPQFLIAGVRIKADYQQIMTALEHTIATTGLHDISELTPVTQQDGIYGISTCSGFIPLTDNPDDLYKIMLVFGSAVPLDNIQFSINDYDLSMNRHSDYLHRALNPGQTLPKYKSSITIDGQSFDASFLYGDTNHHAYLRLLAFAKEGDLSIYGVDGTDDNKSFEDAFRRLKHDILILADSDHENTQHAELLGRIIKNLNQNYGITISNIKNLISQCYFEKNNGFFENFLGDRIMNALGYESEVDHKQETLQKIGARFNPNDSLNYTLSAWENLADVFDYTDDSRYAEVNRQFFIDHFGQEHADKIWRALQENELLEVDDSDPDKGSVYVSPDTLTGIVGNEVPGGKQIEFSETFNQLFTIDRFCNQPVNEGQTITAFQIQAEDSLYDLEQLRQTVYNDPAYKDVIRNPFNSILRNQMFARKFYGIGKFLSITDSNDVVQYDIKPFYYISSSGEPQAVNLLGCRTFDGNWHYYDPYSERILEGQDQERIFRDFADKVPLKKNGYIGFINSKGGFEKFKVTADFFGSIEKISQSAGIIIGGILSIAPDPRARLVGTRLLSGMMSRDYRFSKGNVSG